MKKLKITLLTILLVVCIIATGCASKKQEGVDQKEQDAAKQHDLIIVTGSTGGVYYLWGSAITKIINDYVPNATCTVEATGGQFENPILVAKGDADIGIINVQTAYEGWQGTGKWTKGEKYTNLRVIALAYPSFLTIVTLADSGIDSVQDFEGKQIGVGSPMGTADLVGTEILKCLNIKPKQIHRNPWGEVPNAVRDGIIDAYFAIGGQPWPPNVDLETTHDVKYIELSDEDIAKLKEKYPFWTTQTLPASTYKGLTKDYRTLAWYNLLMVDKRMPEELVYEIVKAMFEHKDIIEDTHPSTAKYFSKDTIIYSSIPLHMGAVRYYKEQGIDLPEKLIPPEGK